MTMTKLEFGPYGLRWSYTYNHEEGERPPTVAEAEKIIGVKLAPETEDATGERSDNLCEVVYFPADDYDRNTIETYRVQ